MPSQIAAIIGSHGVLCQASASSQLSTKQTSISTAVGLVLQITPTQLFGLAPRFGRPSAFETFFEI